MCVMPIALALLNTRTQHSCAAGLKVAVLAIATGLSAAYPAWLLCYRNCPRNVRPGRCAAHAHCRRSVSSALLSSRSATTGHSALICCALVSVCSTLSRMSGTPDFAGPTAAMVASHVREDHALAIASRVTRGDSACAAAAPPLATSAESGESRRVPRGRPAAQSW